MSKQIKLTQGRFATVDDEDFEYLNQWKWYLMINKQRGKYYVQARVKNENGFFETILMHRLILSISDPKIFVDHKFGDGLDNRKENLRICTNAENLRNKNIQKNNISGYKGVSWNARAKKYQAQIQIDRKIKYLGLFTCPIEGAKAYNEAALIHHGKFARLNQIP